MNIYLVDFTLFYLSDEERKTDYTKLFMIKEPSLTKLEELISGYASSSNSTYTINNIKYLGVPFYNISEFHDVKLEKGVSLEELISKITPENRHGEVTFDEDFNCKKCGDAIDPCTIYCDDCSN